MTHAHHHAAGHDERSRGKAELLGAKQRRHDHVAPGLQLAVDLDSDTIAEVVQEQGLLRLGETEFPGDAAVLDGGEG